MTLEARTVKHLLGQAFVNSVADRRPLLYIVFGNDAVLNGLEYEGSPRIFCARLVERLARYGTLADGRNAMDVLLTATKDDVGRDDQLLCDALIAEWHGRRATTQKDMQGVPPPATAPPIEFDWVTIPAGEFLYGDDKSPVYLDTFQISRTLVTNWQYQMFVEAKGQYRPRHWEGRRVHPARMNHPVVNVSWNDAQAFCEWAGVFLPTEQQWEKAALGTDSRKYPWGNEEPTDKLCNFNRNVGDTTPVGKYSPQGDSPYGVADMAGNVWEWCEGWYDRDLKWRAIRGSSFRCSAGTLCCTDRQGFGPKGRHVDVGFRPVVSSPGF